MLNDLIAHISQQDLIMGGVALASLLLGWWAKGLRAGRRESHLKQEVLEAKRSIPQFETTVRSREQTIDRLQLEAKELRARMSEADRTLAGKDNEQRNQAREISVLTTELKVAKRVQSDDFYLEGIDSVVDAEASQDPETAARIAQAEALYGELRSTLVTREERILELEAALETNASSGTSTPPPTSQSEDVTLLEDRLQTHEATIERLEGQLSEMRQDRDMMSGLARSRAKQKENETDSSVELIERITHLERELDLRNQVVHDRDASLKRLLAELEEASRDRAAQKQELEQFMTDVDAVDEGREALEERVSGLVNEIDYLRGQLETEQRELTDVRHELRQSESWLEKYKTASSKRATELAELTAKWDQLNSQTESKAG